MFVFVILIKKLVLANFFSKYFSLSNVYDESKLTRFFIRNIVVKIKKKILVT